MIAVFATVLLGIFFTVGATEYPKVPIEVYYEALCPGYE